MKPFSDNVVFWDTEFSSLDPYRGELLSLGMVKYGGEEFYVELAFDGEPDPYVTQKVLPHLTDEKVSREEAVERMNAFLGDKNPFMVAYVNQFDVAYLYKLLGVGKGHTRDFAFHWIHIDFAAMLFAVGINPQRFSRKKKDFCQKLGVDTAQYRSHHALDDARLLRDVYMKIVAAFSAEE